jgi:RPA family protein
MIQREPAWRVLSGEINASKHILKSSNSKEPNYVLTPLGAKINRVYIVGEAFEVEDMGNEGRSFFRIKVSDPTGIFYLAVGEYQPSALGTLRNIEIPSCIAVVGKLKSYEPENGGLYLSIRPEYIYPANPEIRDCWLFTAVQSLKSRLEAVVEAQKLSNPTIAQIKALGYSSTIAEGVIEAIELYGRTSLEEYEIYLKDALQFLAFKNGNRGGIDPGSGSISGNQIDITPGENSTFPEKIPNTNNLSEGERELIEKDIVKLIEKTPAKRNLGLNWNDLLFEVNKKGIPRRSAEEAVRSL